MPKGPSLDPSQKRLAMHVEDHPVDYGEFEGIIPEGEYGGGTVMLWDRGQWEPVGDPQKGYRQGKLKFQLHGDKLRGGWILVRRRGLPRSGSEKNVWFLIKERDEGAKPLEEGDILVEMPRSIVSGRELDEIATVRERTWQSKRNGKPSRSSSRARRSIRRENPHP